MILNLSIPVGVATPRSCSTEKKQLCIVSAVTPWVVLVDNLLLVSEHGEDFVFPWLAIANSLDHVCELGRQYASTPIRSSPYAQVGHDKRANQCH
jgi:hypothetical protein